MDKLQLIYPYYDNATMLQQQLLVWSTWPVALRARTKIILVDDGSQKFPVSEAQIRGVDHPDLRLYRILINIPWNQNGAHNLGFHVADEGWCLSTDIDHVLTADKLGEILDMTVNPKCYYTFGRRRVREPDAVFKRHPNSWLLTRKMFWQSGGYDEDFSGWYGSDSQFRKALALVGKHIPLPDSCYLTVYDELDIPDANTREFGRKDSKYHSAKNATLAKKRQRAYKAENPLRFPWERVV
jgi:hypothetical protein